MTTASRIARSAVAGAVYAAMTAMPAFAEQPRAVVELFTSQGCSSCPAADKLLGEYANDKTVLAISVPIDYWDYLGWKDTLANPRHTARQRGYASMRGDREVYTPQAVVNGSVHALGSDRNAIEAAVAKTRQKPATLSVPVTLTFKDDRLDVTIAASKQAPSGGEVWACAIAKAVPVAIGRGENRGRTVTYHNVARKWVRVGAWTGENQTMSLPRKELETGDVNAVAVLVQSGTVESPSTILGAALAPIR